MNNIKLPVMVLLGMLLIAACSTAAPPVPTPDVALIKTAAAETVFAQFTLTAAAFTSTPLPPITDTPIPLESATLEATGAATQALTPGATQIVLCDRYSWDPATVDMNYPDGSIMQPGQDFVKTWRIKNAGTCTWGEGYSIIYAGYTDKMAGQAQPFTAVVGPGQEIEISVQFKAPTKLGEYVSAWTLANNQGVPFFGNDNKPVYVKIVVK